MSVLAAEGLSKRFGNLTAVDDLSLQVENGEVFGLLGPNGAGKSTTVSMLCGLLRPDAGKVLVQDQPVTGDVRTKVGVCPQQIVVWKDLGCLEQLVFVGRMYGVGAQDSRRRGQALLDALGLEKRKDSKAKTLSGGMQRRLNIALALVHEPEIVFLDEPEAGLDPQSRVLVRDYIKKLAQTTTVLVTTHNMDEADRVADRVAIIDKGKLLALDTPASLKKSVGPGDVLEMTIEGDPDRAIEAVGELCESGTVLGDTVILRALSIAEKLPEILGKLEQAGFAPHELKLRQSSLEDVFISMTGRGLRE